MSAVGALTISSYLGASIALANGNIRKAPLARLVGIFIATLAVVMHGYILYKLIDTPMGHNLSTANLASMVSWLVAIVLLLTNLRAHVFGLTTIMMLLAAASLGIATQTNQQNLLPNLEPSATLHILLAIVSVSFLLITGVQSLFIAVQSYILKKDPLNRLLQWLPSLETNELLWSYFTKISFVLLTATLFFANAYLDISSTTWASKGSFTAAAWLVLGFIVWGNYTQGIQGARSRWWSIIAGILLLFAYIGSKVFMQGSGI